MPWAQEQAARGQKRGGSRAIPTMTRSAPRLRRPLRSFPYIAGQACLFDDNVFYTSTDRTAGLDLDREFRAPHAPPDGDNYTLRLDTGRATIVRYLETTQPELLAGPFSSLDGRYDIDPGTSLLSASLGIPSASRSPRDAVDCRQQPDARPSTTTNRAGDWIFQNTGRFNTTATAAYQRIQYENSEGANNTTHRTMARSTANQWSIDGLPRLQTMSGPRVPSSAFQGNIRELTRIRPTPDGFHEKLQGLYADLWRRFRLRRANHHRPP